MLSQLGFGEGEARDAALINDSNAKNQPVGKHKQSCVDNGAAVSTSRDAKNVPTTSKGGVEPLDTEEQEDDFTKAKTHELTQSATTSDVITNAIHLADDPSLQAITFRSMLIGDIALDLCTVEHF